jgi:hypothetical protein
VTGIASERGFGRVVTMVEHDVARLRSFRPIEEWLAPVRQHWNLIAMAEEQLGDLAVRQ